MAERQRCDVCVVGGGPAGAVAAFRLATLGRDVCLVERHAFPRPHVGESIGPGLGSLLDSIGLDPLMASVGIRPAGETVLCWAEAQPQRLAIGARPPGRLVDRGKFDGMLLRAARLAGVRVIQPARAIAVRSSKGWRITTTPGSDPAEISARILLDAAGRKGCLPTRKVSISPPTLAWWVRLDPPAGWQEVETRVEAVSEGWIWAAPVGDKGQLSLLHFCDPDHRVARAQVEATLRRRLVASTLFSGCAQAAFFGQVAVLDATSFQTTNAVGADFVKIGEAAYTLDPLSSTGVEKAIQSALVGAAVAHTLLDDPDRADACAHFYRERQRETVARHAAWARRHYSEVERYANQPFWRLRCPGAIESDASDAAQIIDSPPPSLDTLIHLSPEASFSREPCLIGNRIETRTALRWPTQIRPLVFLDGIEVVSLLAAGANQSMTWQELLTWWSRTIPPTRAERLAMWLWQRGILCTVSETSIAMVTSKDSYAR